ncbi:SDR family oxidoreductase [Roseomonas sp. GC11]|uniref:SDR family oxidoreductase n=1 Tax=Roseomonas sp. GC11 TaxID=2950546 RepID=UPI00210C77F4|nr:SDR family oxidoreductase [Roseomonas sp. GC11]MCQ4160382.1 SDR family oxidoreductase [Roseomonas sp. GC11]
MPPDTRPSPPTAHPTPPQPAQQQTPPGRTAALRPTPDHGEQSYHGHGRLAGRVALITGGDSGIGRAVAIAYAREGADLLISYLDEHDDAEETARWVRAAGRRALLLPGDISNELQCRALVDSAMREFGRLDILVNNAALQRSHENIEDISAEEWEATFRTNIHAHFFLAKAAARVMQPGSAIIGTSSINAKDPSPSLLAYATTKGAIANFTVGLARLLAKQGIRVNSVAPGPIWTPLIPSTLPEEAVRDFGSNTPLGRAGQPAELAGAYVLLASEEGSYITGAILPVTGGRPMW